MEAQAFLQAQLPEIEVEGREASLGQVLRQDDGRRCKGGLAPSWRLAEEGIHQQSVSGQRTIAMSGAIPPRGHSVLLLCVEGGLAQLSS